MSTATMNAMLQAMKSEDINMMERTSEEQTQEVPVQPQSMVAMGSNSIPVSSVGPAQQILYTSAPTITAAPTTKYVQPVQEAMVQYMQPVRQVQEVTQYVQQPVQEVVYQPAPVTQVVQSAPVRYSTEVVEVKAPTPAPTPPPADRITTVEKEVPIDKVVTVEQHVPVNKVVTVDNEVAVPKVQVVEKEVAVPQIQTVEVEKIVDRFVDVPQTKIVQQEVEVQVDKIVTREVPVPVEKFVEKVVEVPVQQIVVKEVPVMVERIVIKEVPVEVEKVVIKERVVEVEVERVVTKEVPIEVEKIVEKRVEVQVPVEVKVPYPVEKIVEKSVIKEIEVIKEVPVVVEKVIEKLVTKELPVERTVYKDGSDGAAGWVEDWKYKSALDELERLRVSLLEQSRSQASAPSTVASLPPAEPLPITTPRRYVGLGLALDRYAHDRSIYIKDLIPGFAAHKSGQIRADDILVSIAGTVIDGYDLEAVKNLTMGEEGSTVTLQILRGDQYFKITLVRSAPNNNFQTGV